jgi:Tfp pilus assembly protein FimT
MRNNEHGQTLIELTVAAAIVMLMATASFNVLGRTSRAVSLAAATAELRSIFQHVRTIAIARDRNVGVKFELQNERWTWAVYEDGDGDGVRNDDIQQGRDRRIRRPMLFEHRPSVIGVPTKSVSDSHRARNCRIDRRCVSARRRSVRSHARARRRTARW